MGVVERGPHVPRGAECVAKRELRFAVEAMAQRFAGDVRHHVVERPPRVAGIDQRQDVRVREPRRDSDLLQEALGTELCREVGSQHLDRDLARVLAVQGEVDGRGTATPQLAL